MHRLKNWIPALISFALVTWLVRRVSLADLIQAALQLNWAVLLPATVAMVLALYLWDAVILQALFGTADRPIPYRQALHMRGCSYLATAIHYPLGQAVLGWGMAKLQGCSLLNALSRCLLLGYFDALILLSLGLFGSLLSDDPRVAALPAFCGIGLLAVVAVGLVPLVLTQSQRERLQKTRWGAWLENWSWSRSARIVLLRLLYFSILITYGAMALWISRINAEPMVIFSTIPLVMLADGLPSISGLGTRETAMMFLLRPQRPEVLLAVCLFWSMGLVVGRVLIGLAHLWLPRLVPVIETVQHHNVDAVPQSSNATIVDPCKVAELEDSIERCYEKADR